jgi:hypothetical protein
MRGSTELANETRVHFLVLIAPNRLIGRVPVQSRIFARVMIWFVLFILSLTGFLLWLVPTPGSTTIEHQAFDSQGWRNGTGTSSRTRMIKDLVENVLPGMDDREIRDLLGETNRSLVRDANGSLRTVLFYFLGFDKVALDGVELWIILDERDRFSEWFVKSGLDWSAMVGPPGAQTYCEEFW